MPEELAESVDPDALEHLVRDLHQGDVVDVASSPSLFSPDVPSYPTEVEAVPHEAPVMTMELRLPSGLAVIISQDCDLRRLPNVEPYVLLAPLTELSADDYQTASQRLSTRFFAYPEIPGHEDKERLAVDMRKVASLEKTALLSPHIERLRCPLTAARRGDLREWLGQRLGRPPFPDEIQRQVVDPITEAVKAVRKNQATQPLFSAVSYYGLQYTQGKSYVSLLLLCDSRKRLALKAGEQEISGLRKRLQEAIDRRTRNGDYQVTVQIHDAQRVPAVEVLGRVRLAIDL